MSAEDQQVRLLVWSGISGEGSGPCRAAPFVIQYAAAMSSRGYPPEGRLSEHRVVNGRRTTERVLGRLRSEEVSRS